MAELLLASTSPRRRRLVESLSIAGEPPRVEVCDPGVSDAHEAGLAHELSLRGETPKQVVRALALAKLAAGARRAKPGQLVLAADTTVALGARFLGKAGSRAEARAMLTELRGQTHEVHTGVALSLADARVRTGVATTRVRFASFDEGALEAFLDADLWRGKAGAYGVQDPESAPLVEEVVGSQSNVIGLPLELIEELLTQ